MPALHTLPTVHAPAPTNPHFERLGGGAVVERLVEAFYRHMRTEPAAAGIWNLHRRELRHIQEVLVAYLCEWLGGPKLYSPLRGAPRLGRVHAAFAIGPAERDAWMLCMDLALAEVSDDAALKAELHRAFFKVAEHLTRHTPTASSLTPQGAPA
jgi:hemoglobin